MGQGSKKVKRRPNEPGFHLFDVISAVESNTSGYRMVRILPWTQRLILNDHGSHSDRHTCQNHPRYRFFHREPPSGSTTTLRELLHNRLHSCPEHAVTQFTDPTRRHRVYNDVLILRISAFFTRGSRFNRIVPGARSDGGTRTMRGELSLS